MRVHARPIPVPPSPARDPAHHAAFGVRWYEGLEPPQRLPHLPAIAITLGPEGEPAVFHVDVGQSRSWRAIDPTWVVHPQALVLCPRTAWSGTVMAAAPLP